MPNGNRFKQILTEIKARIEETPTEGDGGPPWLRRVAMLTGVLAAFSGFLAVRSTMLTNDAIYQSNQAILAQAQSSDAWVEYQADSIKARIVETAITTGDALRPDQRASLAAQSKEMRDRQPKIRHDAEDRAADRDRFIAVGLKRLGERDILGFADLAAQIGIALASVAALVRWRIAYRMGITVGIAGIVIAVYAAAGHYGMAP